jgi:hypothetical protein
MRQNLLIDPDLSAGDGEYELLKALGLLDDDEIEIDNDEVFEIDNDIDDDEFKTDYDTDDDEFKTDDDTDDNEFETDDDKTDEDTDNYEFKTDNDNIDEFKIDDTDDDDDDDWEYIWDWDSNKIYTGWDYVAHFGEDAWSKLYQAREVRYRNILLKLFTRRLPNLSERAKNGLFDAFSRSDAFGVLEHNALLDALAHPVEGLNLAKYDQVQCWPIGLD